MAEDGSVGLVEASDFTRILPNTSSQARGDGGTEGRYFVHGRAFNRDTDDVRLRLHDRDTLVE